MVVHTTEMQMTHRCELIDIDIYTLEGTLGLGLVEHRAFPTAPSASFCVCVCILSHTKTKPFYEAICRFAKIPGVEARLLLRSVNSLSGNIRPTLK